MSLASLLQLAHRPPRRIHPLDIHSSDVGAPSESLSIGELFDSLILKQDFDSSFASISENSSIGICSESISIVVLSPMAMIESVPYSLFPSVVVAPFELFVVRRWLDPTATFEPLLADSDSHFAELTVSEIDSFRHSPMALLSPKLPLPSPDAD